MGISRLGTGCEFLSLSVVQFNCMSAQWEHLLLTNTPSLVVSVLVVWSVISCFGHCTARRRQSTMMIIRGLEDLIYKGSFNEVESLARCVRKTITGAALQNCGGLDDRLCSLQPIFPFPPSFPPFSFYFTPSHTWHTKFFNIWERICAQSFSLLSL